MSNSILSPKTFLTYSLGCRTNQAEIEAISLQLTAYGLTPYSPLCTSGPLNPCTFPTIVLLNTCVVTSKAEKETRKEIRKLRKLYPKSFLVVLGCGVDAKKKFKIVIPEADLFLNNSSKKDPQKLTETIVNNLLEKLSNNRCKTICYSRQKCNEFYLNKYQLSCRKFIKIQDGCNCSCAYCIITLLRGRSQNIPPEKVIEEINFWTDRGIKEVILTGINISQYSCHFDQAKRVEKSLSPAEKKERDTSTSQSTKQYLASLGMTYLVKKILKETTVERISFSSIYPEMLTKDFLDLVINSPRITRCFHFSLQSGSPSVLERMNRNTNINELTNYLLFVKKKIPGFTLRADFIAGFPGETEEEFQETINLIENTKISFVHSFPFSVRPDTKAEELIKIGKWQDLPNEIKKERVKQIFNTVSKIRKDEAKFLINLCSNCLMVKWLDGYHGYEGITENGWPILIKTHSGTATKHQSLKGKILAVKITEFKNDQLFGEILSFPT